MNDLVSRLRAFVSSHLTGDEVGEARTKRRNTETGGMEGDCALCTRDSGGDHPLDEWRPSLFTGAPLQLQIDAVCVYEERLAIAADMGMDTGPGAEAESIARREARRVAAGFSDSASSKREGDLVDAALAAFEPIGGLRLVSIHSRGAADDPFQKHRDCPSPGLPIRPHDGLDRDGRGSDSPTPTQEAP